MKKLLSLFLSTVLFILVLPINARAISAKSAILIDGLTGVVLYELNANTPMPMASTTKIMTGIVAIEHLDINSTIKIKREYTLAEGSSMYLKEGEELKILDLLYGLMLSSGNDAALALAGGVDGFIELMNKKALDLGLKNTHFVNPNGLDDPQHYTSASDLALITRYAMQNDIFRTIASTKTYSSGDRFMKNHNKMLWLYDGSTGGKTGFTKKSGRCLVSSSKKNGRELIAVTLNAPSDWSDHASLFNYGFNLYKNHTIAVYQGTTTIYGSDKKSTKISSSKPIDTSILPDETITYKIFSNKFTYAPIKTGDTYGIIKYYINNELISEDILLFIEGADMSLPQPSIWEKIKSFLKLNI